MSPLSNRCWDRWSNGFKSWGASPEARSYDNILLKFDHLTDPLDHAMSIVRHLESVATYPELRAAHNAVQGPVSAFYTSIALNEKLWEAVKAVDGSPNKEALEPVHRRFLQKTVQGFRRAGADLDAAGKKKLEQLDVELTEITTKFSEHVLDATNAFDLVITDETQLAGLPDSARMAAKASAESKGKAGWRFTLQAPSYIAAMTYLDNRRIRSELWDASIAAPPPASSTTAHW